MTKQIDEYGRIVIPKSFRDRLGLRPGTELELTVDGESLRLSPRREDQPVEEDDGVLVYAGESSGTLAGVVDEVRSDRLNEMGSS